MNKTSSIVTGSATVAAAAIAPFVEWLANTLFQLAMPPQVVLIVAAGLVTIGHLVANVLHATLIKRSPLSNSGTFDPGSPGLTQSVVRVPLGPLTGGGGAKASKQGGFTHVGPMLCMAALAIAAVFVLPGCSVLSASIGQYEKGAGQIIVASAERTLCKDLPIGIWLDQYGSNPDRLAGWRAICGNPVQNPVDPGTVAKILQVYPGFQQAAAEPSVVPALPVIAAAPNATPAAPIGAVSAPVAVKATRRPRPVVPPVPAQPVVVLPVAPAPPAPVAPAQTSLLSPPVKP